MLNYKIYFTKQILGLYNNYKNGIDAHAKFLQFIKTFFNPSIFVVLIFNIPSKCNVLNPLKIVTVAPPTYTAYKLLAWFVVEAV